MASRPRFYRSLRRAALVIVASSLIGMPAAAQVSPGDLPDRAVTWLQDYIRIDTVNPPGNEMAGARFLAEIFEAEGIAYDMVESSPGRGNIWARLEGGDAPSLVLLHHIDVVPADPSYWSIGPLSGEVRDGFVYGRGAIDTKGLGMVQLAAFVALHRSGVRLDRDVIYMATADEEAGGFLGVGWLVEHRPELFADVGYVLNEGGGSRAVEDRIQVSVEVTQKVPYWLRVTAGGRPGHGSRVQEATSVTRLVAALDRLREHEFEPRVVAAVDVYFRGLAPSMPPAWRSRYADMATALRNPRTSVELLRDHPGHYSLTRNTCNVTRLGASDKINVVPSEAWAELDCRLLPDQDPEGFLAELGAVLGDDVGVEIQMGFTPAISSAETGLFRTIEEVSWAHFPGATVVPSVTAGFTDSHFLRDLDITAYGYSPFAIQPEDARGVHGNDERLSVENIRRGVLVMLDIVSEWAVE